MKPDEAFPIGTMIPTLGFTPSSVSDEIKTVPKYAQHSVIEVNSAPLLY
jgi:hypothetical protein